MTQSPGSGHCSPGEVPGAGFSSLKGQAARLPFPSQHLWVAFPASGHARIQHQGTSSFPTALSSPWMGLDPPETPPALLQDTPRGRTPH